MQIEFDPNKDAANRAEHNGLSLAQAADFDFTTALEVLDDRYDYGEDRWVAIGFLGLSLHVLVYTLRGDDEEILRPISLRRATAAEVQNYVESV